MSGYEDQIKELNSIMLSIARKHGESIELNSNKCEKYLDEFATEAYMLFGEHFIQVINTGNIKIEKIT